MLVRINTHVTYHSARVTVSRFPLGRQKGTRQETFALTNTIQKEHKSESDGRFILFVDFGLVSWISAACRILFTMG